MYFKQRTAAQALQPILGFADPGISRRSQAVLLIAFSLCGSAVLAQTDSTDASVGRVEIPVVFEPNLGQASADAHFVISDGGPKGAVSRDGVITMVPSSSKGLSALGDSVRLRFLDADPESLTAESPTGGTSNYLLGADASYHIIGATHYRRLRYHKIYPGTDVVLHGSAGRLEYDFEFAAGVSPRVARLQIDGADGLEVGENGDLHITTADVVLVHRKPVAYQIVSGSRVLVTAEFVLRGDREVGFEIGEYDPLLPLVIDPVVDYATYAGPGLVRGIGVDSLGNLYLGGLGCVSAQLPVTEGPHGPGGGQEACVFKLNPQGTSLVYSTYIGGSSTDVLRDLAVDAAGNAYLVGETRSTDLPIVGGFQATHSDQFNNDGFIAKLNTDGDALIYSSYLGGSDGDDSIVGVAVDSLGAAFVLGDTQGGLPLSEPPYPYDGGGDVFVAKVAADGAAIQAGTYFGGAGWERGKKIAVDSGGNPVIGAETNSSDLPLANAAEPTKLNGNSMTGFVAKFNPTIASLVFATHVDAPELNSVAVNAGGDVYATGYTCSSTYPVVGQIHPPQSGCNAFITQYGALSGAYVRSMRWGTTNTTGADLAIDSNGYLVVVGDTTGGSPYLVDPLQSAFVSAPPGHAEQESFVLRFDPDGALVFATLFGGNDWDEGLLVALGSLGDIYFAGRTWSPLFPVTPDAFETELQTTINIFAAKIDVSEASCEYAATPSYAAVGAAGDALSSVVSTAPLCQWFADSKSPWISLTSSPSGIGPGAVDLEVEANGGTRPRLGGVSLSRGGIAIVQDGTEAACPPIQQISVGETAFGALDAMTDCTSFFQDSLGDYYAMPGEAGQFVVIELSSSAFDTWLTVFGPDGVGLVGNDDVDEGECEYFPPACNITGQQPCTQRCSPNNTNSRVPVRGYYRLPQDGSYVLAVTGFHQSAAGDYTLQVKEGAASTTGVFRPTNGGLFLKSENTPGFADGLLTFGLPGDRPVAGDWDGDGIDTMGVFRDGIFFLRNSNTDGIADVTFAFGIASDLPVVGDWDGDGIDSIGVFREGLFSLRNSNDSGPAEAVFGLGVDGDIPISGDWDGDGFDTVGVFRPSNGALFLKNQNSTGFADVVLTYGLPGDKPVTGDWNGDGRDTIGVYRGGDFLLRNSNTNGIADFVFTLGVPGDEPVSGIWGAL